MFFQLWRACGTAGTGEPNDPYQIATAEQLITIGQYDGLFRKHFILVADLDLDPNLPGGVVFDRAPIAFFSGVLDGQGHTISNLHVGGSQGSVYDYAGLFGRLWEGVIKDLNLVEVNIHGFTCGGLVGRNHGTILRCRVSGVVSGGFGVGAVAGESLKGSSLVECQAQTRVSGPTNVGGLVGSGRDCFLERCIADIEVSGLPRIKPQENFGGLMGQGRYCTITRCRAMGTVSGSRNVGGLVGEAYETSISLSAAICDIVGEYRAGGLAGHMFGASGRHIDDSESYSSFINCYAQGSISGHTVGGLASLANGCRATNCYAACEAFPYPLSDRDPHIGGIYAAGLDEVTLACFWDADLSPTTPGSGKAGQGLSTEQMQDLETFEQAGWDFDTVWALCEGDYPQLQWEAEGCNSL